MKTMKTLRNTCISLLLILIAIILFLLTIIPTFTASAHPIGTVRCHFVSLTMNCHAPTATPTIKTWNFIGPHKTEVVQVGPAWILTYTCSEGNGDLSIYDNQNIPLGPTIRMNCDMKSHTLNRDSERTLRHHSIATGDVYVVLTTQPPTHTILTLYTGL